MFNSARLKLTGWYLLIIVFICLSFSAVIYAFLANEVDRFAAAQRFRIERRMREMDVFPSIPLPAPPDPELIADVKERIMFQLLLINGMILLVSGGLSYVLAGRTLMPIKDMMDEQNRFISDASHEFKTPLTSLKSAFEVYLRDKKPTLSDAKLLASESIEEVDRLQSLSESLLSLTQYQKPDASLHFEKISLKETLEHALKKVKPVVEKKKIDIEPDVSDTVIEGNKFGLVDLWVILLDNAIKYSQEGGSVQINTDRMDASVSVKITDAGIGINEDDIPHIFKRFYRADKARLKPDTGGYGLGLSIAKKIVDAHHGTISVASIPGEYTTFTVRLPVKHQKLLSKPSFFS